MKEIRLVALFAISVLLASVSLANTVYADESSDEAEDRKEKMDKEFKKELKEQQKEKIEQMKKDKKELREEYKKKLEEKKKILRDYKNELKVKYTDMKNEFKEKYAQLRISTISESDNDDDNSVEYEIKRNELKLLKLEYREQIKNLKLEAKQHFDVFKTQLKLEHEDRKDKINDRINELKEKYKNKIRQHDHIDSDDLDDYPTDFASKKIDICHMPPGNPDNAHTISVSVNALRAHLAHGDYLDDCGENGEDETDEEFELTVRAETLGEQSEVKIKLEFLTGNTDQALIIDEIIENFSLTAEEADNALKIEEEDDNDLEEKFEIEIEIGDGSSEVEIELRFILDTIDREMIIASIVEKTQLTVEQIEGILDGSPIENDEEEGKTIHVELKEELGIAQQ